MTPDVPPTPLALPSPAPAPEAEAPTPTPTPPADPMARVEEIRAKGPDAATADDRAWLEAQAADPASLSGLARFARTAAARLLEEWAAPPAPAPASAPEPSAAPSPAAAPAAIPGELPSNEKVERAVLGSLVVFTDLVARARDRLRPEHFSAEERRRLFGRICDMSDQGKPVSALTLEAEYDRLHQAGMRSRDLIDDCVACAAAPALFDSYAAILDDFAVRRAQMLAARQIMEDASRGVSRDGLARARALLDRLDDAHPGDEPAPAGLARWPDPMGEAAWRGLAGEFARMIAPRTEADPTAILAQFLIAFGSVIGRHAHFTVDASRHFANEFVVICGLTSRGRKGTSWEVTKLVFDRAAPGFMETIKQGVASGEALIRTVRDPIFGPVASDGKASFAMIDPGVEDKRALWVEEEFQTVLAAINRDTSTLSGNLRKAWQSGTLENATKNSPLKATNAHVSMIGHVTFDELSREMHAREVGNGFANRFLWVCCRRARVLPRGGDMLSKSFQAELAPLVERLAEAVEWASDPLHSEIPIGCTEEAWARWEEAYPALSRPRLGKVGAVTDRAEAHVRRLAMIYALLDREPRVGLGHLESALAFWSYCEGSARYIFGDADVDPVAERVLEAITKAGDEGVMQNQIFRRVFSGRNRDEMMRALGALARACLIRQDVRPTKGRVATFWVAVT